MWGSRLHDADSTAAIPICSGGAAPQTLHAGADPPCRIGMPAGRSGATALGLAVFLLFRRNVLLGAGAGALTLMAGWA